MVHMTAVRRLQFHQICQECLIFFIADALRQASCFILPRVARIFEDAKVSKQEIEFTEARIRG